MLQPGQAQLPGYRIEFFYNWTPISLKTNRELKLKWSGRYRAFQMKTHAPYCRMLKRPGLQCNKGGYPCL